MVGRERVSLDPTVFVHPLAACESDDVGARTRVWAFAHVMAGAVVGADCNVCDHTFVEEGARLGNGVTLKNGVSVWTDVTLEDGVFVGPNAVFTNELRPRAWRQREDVVIVPTVVRNGATLGANATVVCGTTIGRHAFVAAGAVVTRDVPAHALVAGNPARRKGYVCTCGMPLKGSGRALACGDCGRKYWAARGVLTEA
jgi:UDP-2-acetamido-3-amino-2,3-dideoxy-glucuronate N-acetyltransferase